MDDNIHQLWLKAKANRETLNACPKHRFDLGEPPYKLGVKATCLNCGGEMSLTAIFEYVNGFKAAGGNPEEIVKGWE